MSSKYNYSKANQLKDLLPDYRCKRFDLSDAPSAKGRKARAIAAGFLRAVVLDAIVTDSKLISPNMECFSLRIVEKSEKSIKHILKKISKAYTNVDLIKSDGKIYEFSIRQKGIEGMYRTLRIGYNDYKKLVEAVNNGKRYSGIKVTKSKNYLHLIRDEFPKESDKVMLDVIDLFCHNIVQALKRGKDIKIRTPRVRMTIYKNRMYINEPKN